MRAVKTLLSMVGGIPIIGDCIGVCLIGYGVFAACQQIDPAIQMIRNWREVMIESDEALSRARASYGGDTAAYEEQKAAIERAMR